MREAARTAEGVVTTCRETQGSCGHSFLFPKTQKPKALTDLADQWDRRKKNKEY